MTAACDWHHPGADPYSGTKAAAIAYYSDIPAATRAKLLARMEANKPDQVVTITRDAIGDGYEPAIERMHFGRGRVCNQVDRSAWLITEQQPALVYCEDGHCLLEPVICHNVSYIRRSSARTPAEAVPPLTFEPPAAGVVDAAGDAPTTASSSSFEAAAFPTGAAPALPFGPGLPAFYPTLPHFGAVSPVPEPSTWSLMAFGLAAFAMYTRRLARRG